MIKNILFDFGDVFINLDKEVVFRELIKHYDKGYTPELKQLNDVFEVGGISAEEFVAQLHSFIPTAEPSEIIRIWNAMILDFPEYRLKFLEALARENNYRLFLLSNTNALHIPYVVETMGIERFTRFKNCFEQFYLSHEINLRKPNMEVFRFVLNENKLNAKETLFVDDTKENIDAAQELGIKIWHLNVGQEDIIDLKNKL